MCSISVEPMPSRMSMPKRSRQCCADLFRQRLARRDAAPQRDFAARRQVGRCQHRGVERRHAVEDRRLVLAQDAATMRRRGPLGGQDRGGADRHREGQRIAEAIGEEQLGRREHRCRFRRCRAPAWRRARRSGPRCAWRCTTPLGMPGRAGGIEPEADIVGRGVGGLGALARAAASSASSGDRLARCRDDDMAQVRLVARAPARASRSSASDTMRARARLSRRM